jgi:hypothetical protein
MTRAAAWLEELGLGQYAQVFVEQSIDFGVISDLTEVISKSSASHSGHRKRMLTAIGALADANRAAHSDQASVAPAHSSPERGQLTMPVLRSRGSTASGNHWRSAAMCPPALLARADEVIE